MKIREIEEKHWQHILRIQDESYQEIGVEELAVLKSKNEFSPDTCFVSLSDSGSVLGYLLAHPWTGNTPPKLFEPLPNVDECEYLYLHDMAISPHLKGKGIGKALALKLFDVALEKGINRINLVAVQGAVTFWAILGFEEVEGVRVCESYGVHAVMMEKLLVM